MSTVLLILIVGVTIAAIAVALCLGWHRKPKTPLIAPAFRLPPDALPGDMQMRVFILPGCPDWVWSPELPAEILELMILVGTVTETGCGGSSVDITFESAHRKCGRIWANGCYGKSMIPGQPAGIWVSTGHDDFAPQSLMETAFLHELLHHATGLTDTRDSARLAELEREIRRRLAGVGRS